MSQRIPLRPPPPDVRAGEEMTLTLSSWGIFEESERCLKLFEPVKALWGVVIPKDRIFSGAYTYEDQLNELHYSCMASDYDYIEGVLE